MGGTAEAAACHRAEHRGYQPNGDDVVMVVTDRMASLEVSQIILMVPAADLGRSHGLPLQPQGTHPRRPASDHDRLRQPPPRGGDYGAALPDPMALGWVRMLLGPGVPRNGNRLALAGAGTSPEPIGLGNRMLSC